MCLVQETRDQNQNQNQNPGDERSKSKFRKLEIKIKIQETRHPEAVELTTSIEQQGRN